MRSTRCRSGRRCSKGGGERRRSLATAFRPRLEALDDRLVPDASPTTPPVTPPAQSPVQPQLELTANSSLWFYAANGGVGVLAQDGGGNVWWYTGTQAGGLNQVSLLGSWVDPNSPFLGNPVPPVAIPPGVIAAIGGGLAAVPQPVIQIGTDGSWTIEVTITIKVKIVPPSNKPPDRIPRIPPDWDNPAFPPLELPQIAPPPPPGGKPGDPVLPPVPSIDRIPPLPGEKKK